MVEIKKASEVVAVLLLASAVGLATTAVTTESSSASSPATPFELVGKMPCD